MPRPKYRNPLNQELPRVRVSTQMHNAVQAAAKKHDLSVSDLVRACIAHVLDWPNENSDLVTTMIREIASSLEAPITQEEKNE